MLNEELSQVKRELHAKFIQLQYDTFRIKGKSIYHEDLLIDYDDMIQKLAVEVREYIYDNECHISEVSPKQWEEWLDKFKVPDSNECSCFRGCKYCLCTEW